MIRKCIYFVGNHKSLLMTPSRGRCIFGSWSMFFDGSSLARPFFATLLYELISMVLHWKLFNWIKIMATKICHFIIIFARCIHATLRDWTKTLKLLFCFLKLFTAFIHLVFRRMQKNLFARKWKTQKKNSTQEKKFNAERKFVWFWRRKLSDLEKRESFNKSRLFN